MDPIGDRIGEAIIRIPIGEAILRIPIGDAILHIPTMEVIRTLVMDT